MNTITIILLILMAIIVALDSIILLTRTPETDISIECNHSWELMESKPHKKIIDYNGDHVSKRIETSEKHLYCCNKCGKMKEVLF